MANKLPHQAIINYDITDLPTEDTEIDYGYHQPQIDAVPLEEQEIPMDTEGLPIHVEISEISNIPDKAAYPMLRRNGFGGSDSSILLRVNPYTSLPELITQKATPFITEEEKMTGFKTAVRKGNDLEPLIIFKYQTYFQTRTIKPIDMYQFTDLPYLKMNFDGVALDKNNKPWYPVEIKVMTAKGRKHYNLMKAIFSESFEGQGVLTGRIPSNVAGNNISITEKAGHYGIPPYYYTQLQMEMMACNAPFGHLCILDEVNWCIHVFHVYADPKVQAEIAIQAEKAWAAVLENRKYTGWQIHWGSLDGQDMMNHFNNMPRDNSTERRAPTID